MTIDRIKLCAIAAAVATTLTGEAFAQASGTTGSAAAISSPAPAGGQGLSGSATTGQAGVGMPGAAGAQTLNPSTQTTQTAPRARTDPTGVQPSTPAATQPSASKGLSSGANATGTTTNTTTTNTAITGGVPAISGVTPNRAELASSAFTKLDASSRGYLTIEDVRQLDGFETAFRQADQNADGRLNASEFNAAWAAFTGNTR